MKTLFHPFLLPEHFCSYQHCVSTPTAPATFSLVSSTSSFSC